MPHSYSSSNTNHHHPPRARIRGNNTRTFEPLSYKRTNVHTIVTIVRYKFRDTYSGSIKATKAGWFCWLQVHQWRSESPCMSSASAPCPKCWWYSLHSQTHTELTTNSAVRFISFYCYLYTYFPAPFPLYHPSSSVYRRAFISPPPQANSPFFSSTTRSIRRPIAKGSIDRSIVSRSSAPLIPLCRLFPIVCFAIIQSARVQRTFNPGIRQISGIREIRTRSRTSW